MKKIYLINIIGGLIIILSYVLLFLRQNDNVNYELHLFIYAIINYIIVVFTTTYAFVHFKLGKEYRLFLGAAFCVISNFIVMLIIIFS